MEQNQNDLIKQTLSMWVKIHPKPDEPALSLSNGKKLSPRQILDAVESNHPDSEIILKAFSLGFKKLGLEGVLHKIVKN